MKRRWPWAVAVLLSVTGGGLGYLLLRPAPDLPPAAADFLMQHWAQPLAPQGDPPATFSPVEASLAPHDCGSCHPRQYADWRGSLHSRAVGPGIRWQFHVMGPDDANRCLRCHAPLAEQKALLARERRWPGAPASAPPAYVGADLHLQGLVCAACHVRRHRRFGPPPASPGPAPGAHGGFTAEAAFEDSRFCAACHQFPSSGPRVNGKLLEDTYTEWQEWRTRAAPADGRGCQSCHMPQRRHLWRGVHDPATVEQALGRSLDLRRAADGTVEARARLDSRGVGHYLPTYVVPKIYATLELERGDGAAPAVLARHTIGRVLDVDLAHEQGDTRLPPGGEAILDARFAAPAAAARVVLRIEVAPAEHYERMFSVMEKRYPGIDRDARGLLREAQRRAVASRYRLKELAALVPEAPGRTRVAN